ncbi:VOC family protein [Streptomyces sp. HPF1205]|uniref:VOC family protein n=1 Tax=Streptomyces sp. HPF1205 TaxID=2873262 RepID=UPI001CED36C8|nr:VOC family protein [Streptomyces sp. HPF1205]
MTGTGQRGTLQRMDNVAVVVDDLDAAKAFFTELGMELEGEATLEGSVVDRLIGLDAVLTDIAMMRTPDGSGRIELTKYHRPASPSGDQLVPVYALGAHRVMFAVTDIQDVVGRLEPHGAELLGDIVSYENSHRLAYLRGPGGIVLALAEQLT